MHRKDFALSGLDWKAFPITQGCTLSLGLSPFQGWIKFNFG
jgi:hypothetical protein